MTFFESLHKPKKDISLNEYYDLVRGGHVREKIELIHKHVAEDNRPEVDKIKKSLPSVTLAGEFKGGRKAEYFVRLTGMLVLDIDHLQPDEMARLRRCFTTDPHVLMVNTSPSGQGLKVIIAYATPDGTLPATWDECRPFYYQVFLTVQKHYSETYGCEVDASGKDITRLTFLSYDPEAYLNLEAEPMQVAFSESTPSLGSAPSSESSEKAPRKAPKIPNPDKDKRLSMLTDATSKTSYLRRRELFHIVCRNLYRQRYKYEVGSRHHFMYMAVCDMNEYGIPLPEVMQMAMESLPLLRKLNGDNTTELLPLEEIGGIVNSVYNDQKKKFRSKPVKLGLIRLICLTVEINLYMKLRHNIVSSRLEYIMLDDYNKGSRTYNVMTDRVENSLATAMDEMQCPVRMDDIRKLFNSEFVPFYDPIADYINSLPQWDGHDYMADLVGKLDSGEPERVYKLLSMWYIGTLATYNDPINTNEIVIVFYTPSQGKGKTRFIDRMLPPQLRQLLYRVGYFIPGKDFERFLGSKLVVFFDEFQSLDRDQHKAIQNYVSAKGFDNRRPYERNPSHDLHRASFIAACNNTNFMNNADGNRRPHVIQLNHIDYNFEIDYDQLFAQLVHKWKVEKLKYYFDSDDQEELAEVAHPYEHNTTEYELVRKYVRMYPAQCKQKESYSSREISIWLQKFDQSLELNQKCSASISKAMGRRNFFPKKTHDGNTFECYLLTQEQVDYIRKYRDSTKMLDVKYDRDVPRELLIADKYASEENMLLAKKCLDEADGDMKVATLNYKKLISLDGIADDDRRDELPF
jgi:hypothetical protein